MSNPAVCEELTAKSYEELTANFDWSIAERELGYKPGEPINIGWMCSDRICRLGMADKLALLLGGLPGQPAAVHLRRPARSVQHRRAVPLRSRHPARRARLPVHGPRARAVHRLPRHPEDGSGGAAAVLRLRRRVAARPAAERRHLGDHHPEEAPAQGAQDPRAASEPAAHHRRGRQATLRCRSAKCRSTWSGLPRVEEFAVYPTTAESPSVLHYTSGTTGQPKGAQHVHYSIISQYLTAKWVLDLQPDDIYWCNADPGWVTGTSYGIIGPWSNGMTQVVLDSGFNAERWYEFIEKHRVTVWYSAPTAIRLLMKEGTDDRAAARPLQPAPPGQRGRAAQRRGGDLVAGGVRQALPRHLLADRNRLHRDHQFPRHADQARLDGQAVPGDHRDRAEHRRPTSRSPSRALPG